MNILHLRYAIEVDRTRSISKAAENLFMNQSNLSRSIRELEQSLGVTLFRRTSKGMTPTPQGEQFIAHAKEIVAKIDHVESLYKSGGDGKIRFALSAPRSESIASAFGKLAKEIPAGACELYYKETNPRDTVEDLLQSDYRLGILRYQTEYDPYFKAWLHEKDILCEPLAKHPAYLILSADDPLAERDEIDPEELAAYIQICYPDQTIPTLSHTEAMEAQTVSGITRHIYVHDRASALELPSQIPNAFLWMPALSPEQLSRYRLVQIKHTDKEYLDLLIYRKGYHMTPYDRRFVELLHTAEENEG